MQLPPQDHADDAPEEEVKTPRNYHLPISNVIAPGLHPYIFLEGEKYPQHEPGRKKYRWMQKKWALRIYLCLWLIQFLVVPLSVGCVSCPVAYTSFNGKYARFNSLP